MLQPNTSISDWFSPDDGLTRLTTTILGHKISYVTGGQGEPIILIHGLGADSTAWWRIAPQLAQHYRVYALDLFGCGQSDKPDFEYTIEAQAHYLKLFMERLGIAHAHMMGHSLGGGVAMQVAYFFPEIVDRLILISSGGLGRDVHWLIRASTLPGADGVIGLMSDPRSGIIHLASELERRRMKKSLTEYEGEIPVVLEQLRDHEARRVFLRMTRAIGSLQGQTINALPLLKHLAEKPVLIVWGASDEIIPVAHGHAAAQVIPRAHLVVIPDCYHRPHIEAHAEFYRQTIGFLQATEWPPHPVVLPQQTVTTPAPKISRDLIWMVASAGAAAAVGISAGIGVLIGTAGRRSAKAG